MGDDKLPPIRGPHETSRSRAFLLVEDGQPEIRGIFRHIGERQPPDMRRFTKTRGVFMPGPVFTPHADTCLSFSKLMHKTR